MPQIQFFSRFKKALFTNQSVYGQDEQLSMAMEDDQKSPVFRQHYTDQCAEDNRFPSLVMTWLALSMECLMLFFYIIQPFVSSNTPFFPNYLYLYVSMIVFCLTMLVLLHIFWHSPSAMRRLELLLLLVMSLWSAAFSAMDIINGFSSYLYIQIIIIQSLLYRGSPVHRCLFNVVSFVVYLVILLPGCMDLTTLFAETINPFFMAVMACAIILVSDGIQLKNFCDREQIRKQHAMLEHLANNDFLTNIPNRKCILEYLEKVLSLEEENVSCMMVDVDNYKSYNDTCGHIRGDECLIQIANIMQKIVFKYGGRIGRYGGDEFFVVLTGMDRKGSLAIAEEMVNVVQNERIEFESCEGQMLMTLSVGVATGLDRNTTPHQLIHNADRALYYAKSKGKNRACVYAEQACPQG